MPDPFPQESQESKVPTTIGSIDIVLHDLDGVNLNRTVTVHLVVLDQSGVPMKVVRRDLQPHLTTAQINGLLTLMNAVRTKAEGEII